VPTAFEAQVVHRVSAGHPAGATGGEVIHGDYPEFVATSGGTGLATHSYELWKAILERVNDHNLVLAGSRPGPAQTGFLETFAPLTLVGTTT